LEGQTCLLSSGAPDSPVHHRTITVAVRCVISFLFWRIQPLVLGDSWCTPDSPVCPTDRCCGPSVARGLHDRPLRWRPLAHRIVRCTTGPLVNYSRTPPSNLESGEFTANQPGTPDTVRCTTGQSSAPDQSCCLAAHSQVFSILFLFFSALFLTLRQIH
jgi:hypothetical protein